MKSIGKAALTSFLLLSPLSYAAEGGYSNYIPGFYGDMALAMAPQNGLSVKNDVYFYSADTDKTMLSGNIFAEVDIELLYNYTTFLYKTDYTIFGGEYAAAATIVYGGPDVSAIIGFGERQVKAEDSLNTLGDLTLAPLLLYWNDGNFNYNVSHYIVAPTASYDADRVANSGLNYWTFETDFAASYTNFETGQDYSVIVGYNYNTENKDTDYQTGQEVHIDVILNQFVTDELALGIQAFHLQQITKDKGDGANLGSFKARATGIGPAINYVPAAFGGTVAITGKWLKEIDSENRIEGDHVFFSIAASF